MSTLSLDEYLDRLEISLAFMERSTCDGVSGVLCIDSGKPGPVVGITACTHGNEPSGLAAIKHLLEEIQIQDVLRCGMLYLCVNNLEAARAYFNERVLPDDKRPNRRMIHHNMNRLPDDLLSLPESDQRSEIVRSKELMKIWRRFTHGFDIHSTTMDSPPMIITGNGVLEMELVKDFPIEIVIDRIDMIQIGKPAFGFYGDPEKPIPVLEIEAGTHLKVESFDRAGLCAALFLRNLKMIDVELPECNTEYQIYEIFDSVVFPDTTYRLARQFIDFEVVAKGSDIAFSPGLRVVAAEDCVPVFPPKGTAAKGIGEEVMFLSKPVRVDRATG